MPYDFGNSEAQRIAESLYREGFTQEGVDRLYQVLGLGVAPRVPAGLIGNRLLPGRTSTLIVDSNGKTVGTRSGEIGDFLNNLGKKAIDPYREYGVGNYLGLAGMLVGGAGAAGAFSGAGAAAGGTTAAGTGTTAGTNLGVFANGGVNGLAGVGAGNAGALAASGGIAGGAGIGGTMAGAFGGLSGLANSVSGAGGNMGWDWGRVLDYGIPLVGGLLEADGAKDAARAEQAGAAAALAENRRQYDTTRQDMMPWLDAGKEALARLNNPISNFNASPDYQFRRDEGMRGIENSFAARGGAASGNALRALTDFNSNIAANEYGNWWNRNASQAGLGQTTAQNLGSFGANSAANAGNILQNGANARASGITGQTNAWTNILGNLGSVWNRRNG